MSALCLSPEAGSEEPGCGWRFKRRERLFSLRSRVVDGGSSFVNGFFHFGALAWLEFQASSPEKKLVVGCFVHFGFFCADSVSFGPSLNLGLRCLVIVGGSDVLFFDSDFFISTVLFFSTIL